MRSCRLFCLESECFHPLYTSLRFSWITQTSFTFPHTFPPPFFSEPWTFIQMFFLFLGIRAGQERLLSPAGQQEADGTITLISISPIQGKYD